MQFPKHGPHTGEYQHLLSHKTLLRLLHRTTEMMTEVLLCVHFKWASLRLDLSGLLVSLETNDKLGPSAT